MATKYRKFSYKELTALAIELEDYSSIFYTIWSNVIPEYTTEISTAAVYFDTDHKVTKIGINPDFWDTLDTYTKTFILAHECLHIILDHGIRYDFQYKTDHQIANIAMDLAVNHKLVNNFGFNRYLIKDYKNYCWVDTIFKRKVDDTQSFEYYYNLLKDIESGSSKCGNSLKDSAADSFDSHEGLDSLSQEDEESIKEIKESIAKKIKENNSIEELKEFKQELGDIPSCEMGRPGEPLIPGTIEKEIKLKRVPPKKKWESVIKEWTRYDITEGTEYQWVTEDRRFASVNKTDLLLPQLGITEGKDYNKIDILFFLDCSGSCYHLSERFFDAAMTLNPKRFNVRLFSRTTEVCELDITKRVIRTRGYGSDDFGCMERFIQKEKAKGIPYPDAIFHITDGGDCSGVMIDPEYPERWHWFLTGNYTRWIPKTCNIHKLSDFE